MKLLNIYTIISNKYYMYQIYRSLIIVHIIYALLKNTTLGLFVNL